MARKLWLFGIATVVALAAAASTGSKAEGALSCPSQPTVKAFLPWLDIANYVLVGNGSLESSTGWKLAGGATVVSGNEPWKVNRSSDSRSLYLPSGSSATSPPFCATLLSPTLRFFARNSGSATATLRVEAITNVLGIKTTTLVGVVLAGSWQPTLPLPLLTSLLSPVTGTVQYKFTPVGKGSGFAIDDVYVDPFKQR